MFPEQETFGTGRSLILSIHTLNGDDKISMNLGLLGCVSQKLKLKVVFECKQTKHIVPI